MAQQGEKAGDASSALGLRREPKMPAGSGAAGGPASDRGGPASERVTKSDAEWRRLLSPEQYAVTRRKATERPFSGEYEKTTTPGTYRCVCCGAELFESDAKFD